MQACFLGYLRDLMAPGPRVRFAPSPTGYLHIGGARTALFNWLWARQQKGTFILRMEDTDQKRSTPESVQAILDGLRWVGIDWDEGPEVGGKFGPYFQTQRMETYAKYAEDLIAKKRAYRCYCTPEEIEVRRKVAESEKRAYKYEGTCFGRTDVPAGRTAVIRFRMPQGDGTVSYEDRVIGKITKPYSDLDDWVMLRADGIPLYNYGCVIDDHLMEITLVGRGQEHINSTFPQLMLYEALGWTPPQFAHFPLILGADREKLSKRLHPEADVMAHKKNGVHPEALNNFIVRLGWGHGNDEVISREQQLEWFSFEHVGATSGVWNPEKLTWLNLQYMKTLPTKTVAERLVPFLADKGITTEADSRLERVVVAFRERAKSLKEMADMAGWVYSQGVTLDEAARTKHLTAAAKPLLEAVKQELQALAAFEVAALDGVIKVVSEKAAIGMGKVAQPVRVAVTGNTMSPGIGETLALVGKTEVLARLDAALSNIQA